MQAPYMFPFVLKCQSLYKSTDSGMQALYTARGGLGVETKVQTP